MITKQKFCEGIEVLRAYANWEKKLYALDIDLASTPVPMLAEKLQFALCDFDEDWAYDKKLDFDWIIEWTYEEEPCYEEERHGVKWNINSAEALYDFLVFMNEHGWEEPNETKEAEVEWDGWRTWKQTMK